MADRNAATAGRCATRMIRALHYSLVLMAFAGVANAADARLGTPLISERDLVHELSSLTPAQLKPLLARHSGRVVLIFADAHADSYTVKSILEQDHGAGLHWRFRPRPPAAP